MRPRNKAYNPDLNGGIPFKFWTQSMIYKYEDPEYF
jgi:hypothetical protein